MYFDFILDIPAFFFLWVHTENKKLPDIFCIVRKNEFHPWKKFISLNSIHEKINFLTCIVTRCIMYFFMYEADWKHFFLAETFFHGGILFFFVCWAKCKTFFFFFALYMSLVTGQIEKEGVTHSKRPQARTWTLGCCSEDKACVHGMKLNLTSY